MKKKFLLLAFVLPLACLVGCGQTQKVRLTYGLYSSEELGFDRFKKLTYEGLKTRIENKESMLVATYKGEGASCGCWKTFTVVAKNYNEKYHSMFYLIPSTAFGSDSDTFGMRIPENDTVSLSVFSEGKLTKQWLDNKDTEKMFTNVEELRKEVNKVISDPACFYIDENSLDHMIADKSSVNVYFAKTDCPDCTSLERTLLFPYIDDVPLRDYLYIFDVATYSGTARYQEIKDKYNLSTENNKELGYGKGVMPTMQHYANHKISDMAVIYNDTVSKVDNKYTVSESYYNSERVSKLEFLNKCTSTKVLQGLELSEAEVDAQEWQGQVYCSWKHEAANKYYKPIFEAFMNTYLRAIPMD